MNHHDLGEFLRNCPHCDHGFVGFDDDSESRGPKCTACDIGGGAAHPIVPCVPFADVLPFLRDLPRCSGEWTGGSGGHRVHGVPCQKLALWDDGFVYCDEHVPTGVHAKYVDEIEWAVAARTLMDNLTDAQRQEVKLGETPEPDWRSCY